MNTVCMMIKKQTVPNFINLETMLRTYDRSALVCGAPAWEICLSYDTFGG